MPAKLFLWNQCHCGQAQDIELSVGRYVVGRSENCDVVVADKTVSGRHAELEICDGFANVSDLGSRNGIFVNRERVVSPIREEVASRLTPAQLAVAAAIAEGLTEK